METHSSSRGPVRFGPFEVDLRTGELRKQGLRVRLQELPFQVLAALLERPGELVTREELRQRLWPGDTFVDFENGLNSAVNRLRQALADSAEEPRYVETLPRRGYRFIAEIGGSAEASPAGSTSPAREKPYAAFQPWYRGLAGVALVLLVLAAAFYALRGAWTHQVPTEGRVKLAVLPFRNLSGDQGQDYFSAGLTEEMVTRFSRLDPGRVAVIAGASVRRYQHSEKDAAGIASELGADYAFTGSVRREADRVRISVQLVRAGDRTVLWAENYDREAAGVLTVHDEVARRVAASLALRLLPASQPAASRAANSAAYEAYWKGRYHWNKRSPEEAQEAIRFFQEAITADANFAPAYAGLADAHNYLGGTGAVPAADAYARAREAAEKAIALDPSLAEAHAAMAQVKLNFEQDWAGAGESFRRALELNPNLATAHLWYACYLTALGRHEEAISEALLAQDLDPLSFVVSSDTGWYYFFSRRYDDAVRECRRALELEPGYGMAAICIQVAYIKQGNYSEALAEARRFLAFAGASEQVIASLSGDSPREGVMRAWRIYLDSMRRTEESSHVSPFVLAMHQAILGETPQLLDSLERAAAIKDPLLVYADVNPLFDEVRNEPRFQRLVKSLRLPPRTPN